MPYPWGRSNFPLPVYAACAAAASVAFAATLAWAPEGGAPAACAPGPAVEAYGGPAAVTLGWIWVYNNLLGHQVSLKMVYGNTTEAAAR